MNIKTLAASALLLLAVAACSASGSVTPSPTTPAGSAPAASAPTASAPGAGASTATNATPITVRDFKFDTPDVAVTGTVALAVTNAGPTVHDLTIRDSSGKVLGETADLTAGASETLTVDLPAGKYVIFCSLPGHESLGIKGTLTVTK
ncbi:MAG TPA: cupredoxin domain-containing protein [Patescibacteria group bacterium]|nr:cupredoxin domain-containing protein [Patescibacteria group bacterium]